VSDQDQQEEKRNAKPGGNGADSDPPGASEGGGGGGRLAEVEAERDEAKDRMLRIAADFENWKKRARKEQDDAEAKARESVLKDMLDVMDNLERATSAYGSADRPAAGRAADGAAVLKGVGLVLRLFQSKLERYGVKPIEVQGQVFDPRIHEAISRTETAEVPAGSVASELQRGYRIGDRLLRPSMVSVAVAPATAGGRMGEGGGGDKIS
jgi:molecular chaperone GrpE